MERGVCKTIPCCLESVGGGGEKKTGERREEIGTINLIQICPTSAAIKKCKVYLGRKVALIHCQGPEVSNTTLLHAPAPPSSPSRAYFPPWP